VVCLTCVVCLVDLAHEGFRWFATSLMFLVEVPVFCGLFIAGMSVAGDWL
jgi:hypothetical protein